MAQDIACSAAGLYCLLQHGFVSNPVQSSRTSSKSTVKHAPLPSGAIGRRVRQMEIFLWVTHFESEACKLNHRNPPLDRELLYPGKAYLLTPIGLWENSVHLNVSLKVLR